MNAQPDHRTRAEDALAKAQRNPVMSAEQSFLTAQIHALLAVEQRLETLVDVLRDAGSQSARVHTRIPPEPHREMQDQLDRAADDGWPDSTASSVAS